MPHLLLQLVEDELNNNVVFHLEQLGCPLRDPRLENIQLHLRSSPSETDSELCSCSMQIRQILNDAKNATHGGMW